MRGECGSDKTKQLITSIQNYVQGHLSEDLSLTVIANYVNYNESHVSRLFKRMTGDNLTEYITACRIAYADSSLPGQTIPSRSSLKKQDFIPPSIFPPLSAKAWACLPMSTA